MDELNHRVKNMLTIVGSLARQMLRSSPSPKAFSDAFLGRLQSMARSHTLLSREHWGETELKDILSNEFTGVLENGSDRISLDGAPVAFPPSMALSLGMIVHELIANAVKYGALSSDKGRVAVRWTKTPEGLQIVWEERDGPVVKAPSAKGLGTELIEQELTSTLRGKVQFNYAAEGLTVRIAIPAATLRTKARSAHGNGAEAPP